MQGLNSRVRTLVVQDPSVNAGIDLPSTVRAASLTDADAVVLSGRDRWAEYTIHTFRSLGIQRPILLVRHSSFSAPSRPSIQGADVCIWADASESERIACINAIQRLSQRQGTENPGAISPPHATPEACLVPSRHALRIADVEYVFGRSPFAVLAYLYEHQGKWVSREELISDALATHHASDSSIIRFHIHSIRKTLGRDRNCVASDARHRRGYMFSVAMLSRSVDMNDQ